MKKLVAAILSLFYLVLSSSATINLHYCGGELANVGVNADPLRCCCSDMESQRSCCQDHQLVFKLDVDQNIVTIQNNIPENIVLLAVTASVTDIISERVDITINVKNYKLPPPKPEPIWLMNCTFTYYG